jgi:hypothetical protein
MRSHWQSRGCAVGRFVSGVLLVSLGLFFLLTNLRIIQSTILRVWWPVILIAVGMSRLAGWWLRARKPYSDFV